MHMHKHDELARGAGIGERLARYMQYIVRGQMYVPNMIMALTA